MKVEINPHSPYWKLYYAKEEQVLLKALKKANISPQIAHIGSTAVPDLWAKPTIDILIGLRDTSALDECIPVFQQLGYIYVSKYEEDLPFRRFFIKIKAINPLQKWTKQEIGLEDMLPSRQSYLRVFHVHIVHKDTLFYQQHLAFRNHLRANQEDRFAYEQLKKHLAQLDWETENDYAQAKSIFINEILERIS